jgi:15-cis-phytoene synthase
MLLRRMRLPRRAIAAGLPAVLARRDLRRILALPPQRGLTDRLAVTFAGIAARV